jgi:D-sedoheptulose 7-phosphate isomerase
MASDLNREAPLLSINPARLKQIVEAQAALRSLSEALVFDADGRILARTGLSFALQLQPVPDWALQQARAGDVAILTSISNDYDFTQVFSKQLAALGHEGDVVIGISTSGNSANVIKAVEVAKKNRMKTVILTGGSGGKLAGMADYTFTVPTKHTPRIQETHITLGHVICQMVDEELFGNSH